MGSHAIGCGGLDDRDMAAAGIDRARTRPTARARTLPSFDSREDAMSDRGVREQSTGTDSADASESERQAPQLSPEEIERLEDFEDLESLIEEPPDGSLSIISDQNVPGAPG
jgi:hypothetical protein